MVGSACSIIFLRTRLLYTPATVLRSRAKAVSFSTIAANMIASCGVLTTLDFVRVGQSSASVSVIAFCILCSTADRCSPRSKL